MTAWTGWTEGASRAELAGRWLVLLVLVGVMISPPLAIAGQVGLIALVLVSRRARTLLAATWREPVVKAVVAFLAVVAIGIAYSAAGYREGLSTLWGWRKLLMLPLAMAFFRPPESRRWLAAAFVLTATAAAVLSFIAFFLRIPLPTNPLPGAFGVVARNHSTQGALFAVATFAAAWSCVDAAVPLARRRAALACALLLAANIVFVTPGRSGYVVLLVCGAAGVLGWALAKGHGLRPGLLGAAVVVPVLLAAMVAVPASRGRIMQALDELQTYQQQTELTSMGIRMVFWTNTLPIIAQRPLVGWGSGSFETVYAHEVGGRPGLQGMTTRDPHNQYLAVAAQHGLLGLAVFLALIGAAFRQRAPLGSRVLGTGVLAAWCVTGLANSHFATFAEGTFLACWLGAMLGSAPD